MESNAIALVEKQKFDYLKDGNLGQAFILESTRFNLTEKITRDYYGELINSGDENAHIDNLYSSLKGISFLEGLTKSQLKTSLETLLFLRLHRPYDTSWRVKRDSGDKKSKIEACKRRILIEQARTQKELKIREELEKEIKSTREKIGFLSTVYFISSKEACDFFIGDVKEEGSGVLLKYLENKLTDESDVDNYVDVLYEKLLEGGHHINKDKIKNILSTEYEHQLKKMKLNLKNYEFKNVEFWASDMLQSLEAIINQEEDQFYEYIDALLRENNFTFTREEYVAKVLRHRDRNWAK